MTFFFLRSCQNSVLLHLPTCGMLRCRIFSCTCQHVGCYAAALANMLDVTLPLLALANMRDVTLPHLLLHLPTCRMLRCRIFSCTCQHVGCHAAASSLALANMLDVTLPLLLLHFPTCEMLRCRIFSCTCQHVGCYAAASSLALAKLWDVSCRIFSCTCQHVGCYAAASSLALPNSFATEQQKWGPKQSCQKKKWKWWRAESPANTIESVFRRPSSWHFIAILQIAMLTKHCEGWKIHDMLLLKMLILSGASSARVTFFSHLVKAVSHKGLEIASMNTEDVVSPMGPKNQSILWAHCPTQAAALRRGNSICLRPIGNFASSSMGSRSTSFAATWCGKWTCPLPLADNSAPASRSCCMLYAPHLQDTIVSHFSEPNWKVRRHNSHNCTCPRSTATVTKPFR